MEEGNVGNQISRRESSQNTVMSSVCKEKKRKMISLPRRIDRNSH